MQVQSTWCFISELFDLKNLLIRDLLYHLPTDVIRQPTWIKYDNYHLIFVNQYCIVYHNYIYLVTFNSLHIFL